MKVRKLQSKAGRGVKIGDHESQIVSRLGRPKAVERSGSQTRIFRYDSNANRGEETYTFRSGRLVEIQFKSNREDDEE